MWRRLAQILGLLLCVLGWGLVGCTLAMDHWRVAQLGGQGGSSVVVTAWFWSDLWRDCYEDSTSVVNCVDLGVLWAVKPYIQAVRGLLMSGLCLGLIGTVLTFFGLECTYIGGDRRSKDRIYEAGPPLYLGLVGSFLIFLGCCVHCSTTCRVIHPERHPTAPSIREKHEENEVLREKKHIYRQYSPSNDSKHMSSYKISSVVIV
ncbi:claudin-10-like [Scomber scombrus]|uniref:claudin-10-like n=1 Tax=Scomber scombrus TaxID=13677 RepID=UPI002DD8B8D1|nr:claudin-10-like [Scomber scombrus]